MLLSVGYVHTRIERESPAERAWLRDYLCFPDSRPARYRPSTSDGKVRLLNEFAASFPTGFFDMVAKAARAEKFRVDVVDRRERPAERDPATNLAWLRDYQRPAVDALVERGRGILAAPTGSGKTDCMVGIARALPCRWLVLAPAADLVVQAAERWEKRNEADGLDFGPAGVIGAGKWALGPRFTAATFQTMHAGLKKKDPRVLAVLRHAQGIMCDESHTVAADTFQAVAYACTSAYFRFGFSGTPMDRGDSRSVLSLAALGPVVYRIKAEPLIAAGVLSRPRIRMATVTQPLAAPFDEAYMRLIVHSKKRNERVVDIALVAAKPCFVFVEREEHGRVLQKLLAAAGAKAEFVYGKKKVEERKRLARDAVARGAILICSRVFQQGIDVPELASIVNAAGYESTIATIQRLGRGMRVTEGKSEVEVWDFFDVGNEYLARHARTRRNTYAAQGYETVVEPEAP